VNGRVFTSSRLKSSVLVIEAEERRFLGINNFIFILGSSFGGVLQTLNSEKVNFDAEQVTNLSIAQHRFVHHCSSELSIASCLQGELCRYFCRVCRLD